VTVRTSHGALCRIYGATWQTDVSTSALHPSPDIVHTQAFDQRCEGGIISILSFFPFVGDRELILPAPLRPLLMKVLPPPPKMRRLAVRLCRRSPSCSRSLNAPARAIHRLRVGFDLKDDAIRAPADALGSGRQGTGIRVEILVSMWRVTVPPF